MAKIIEVSGPAGAGKTTIIRAMLTTWTKDSKWMLHKNLLPRQKINFLQLASLAENLPFLVRFGKTHLDEKLLNAAGARFTQQFPAYTDAFLENVVMKQKLDINGVDRRISIVNKFKDMIQAYQFMKEMNTDKFVLYDEGLMHILPVVGSLQNKTLEEDQKDIFDILKVMPLPARYIYIDTDVETIVERVLQRKKRAHLQKNKTADELKQLTEMGKKRMIFAKDILASFGVPILDVNSKNEIPHNKELILDFIEQMYKTSPEKSLQNHQQTQSVAK